MRVHLKPYISEMDKYYSHVIHVHVCDNVSIIIIIKQTYLLGNNHRT